MTTQGVRRKHIFVTLGKIFTVFIAIVSLTAASAAQSWPAGKLSNTLISTTRYPGCEGGSYWERIYGDWVYKDSSGVAHSFGSGTSEWWQYVGDGPCESYCNNFNAWSTDGKGYYLQTNCSTGTISIEATVFPKYHILSLLYDAPGNQSSNGFTDTTFYGTTNSIGSSFSSGVTLTFTATGGIFGLGSGYSTSVGFTEGYGTTNAFTNTFYSGQGLTLKSTRNPIDHTNDTFWLWLNPEVAITQTGASAASYLVSPPSGQVMDAVRVSVAEMQNPSTIPLAVLEPITINGVVYPGLSNVCAHPLPPSQCTQANACGCVASDFSHILGTDPIISISGNTPPSQTDSKRYFPLNPSPSPFPYLEYGTTDTITVTDASQSSQTQTETSQYQTSYSTIWGSSSTATPVDWTLQWRLTDTFTWTQNVSLTNFSGTQHQMTLILGTSTSGCDAAIDVFEDYDYHTFVESYASTPPTPCDSN